MEIYVPKYERNSGFRFAWEPGFVIRSEIRDGYVLIEANKEGLISLARHLLEMADDGAPEYTHFHLDDYGELEKDSVELVIVKRNLPI